MSNKKLIARIVFGSLMIIALIVLFWLDYYFWEKGTNSLLSSGLIIACIVGFMGFFSAAELINFARSNGASPITWVILPGTLLLIACALRFSGHPIFSPVNMLSALLLLSCLGQILHKDTIRACANLAWTAFILIYIGSLLAFIVLVRNEFGPVAFIVLAAGVKGSDIGAFFTGSMIGRHKLIPWLSPGKTVEGLFGGVLFGVLLTIFSARLFESSVHPSILNSMSMIELAAVGAMFALVGQFGDLSESLLKRDANLKDSGSVIPEFGGILDLVDSMIPTGFVWYMVLKCFSGHGGIW